jgi:hypothetical protein
MIQFCDTDFEQNTMVSGNLRISLVLRTCKLQQRRKTKSGKGKRQNACTRQQPQCTTPTTTE